MAETWPSTLPQNLNVSNASFSHEDNLIKSEVEYGPEKRRPRYTASYETFTGYIIVDTAQYQTFFNFWRTDILFGADAFNWKHPITGVSKLVEFTEVYSVNTLGNKFKINLAMRILP